MFFLWCRRLIFLGWRLVPELRDCSPSTGCASDYISQLLQLGRSPYRHPGIIQLTTTPMVFRILLDVRFQECPELETPFEEGLYLELRVQGDSKESAISKRRVQSNASDKSSFSSQSIRRHAIKGNISKARLIEEIDSDRLPVTAEFTLELKDLSGRVAWSSSFVMKFDYPRKAYVQLPLTIRGCKARLGVVVRAFFTQCRNGEQFDLQNSEGVGVHLLLGSLECLEQEVAAAGNSDVVLPEAKKYLRLSSARRKVNKLQITLRCPLTVLEKRILKLWERLRREYSESSQPMQSREYESLVPDVEASTTEYNDAQQYTKETSWKRCTNWKNQHKNGSHLVVLVHGLSGSSLDFTTAKQQLTTLLPSNFTFLCSQSNDCRADLTIRQQGANLAEQIHSFIRSKQHQVTKLSFVGHSLGGLVARAALPYLADLAHQLDSFISLSTPHTGYLESSRVTELGARLVLQSSKYGCFKELLFEDRDRFEDSYLYRLADAEGLNWFDKILFFASAQDNYIPVESALANGAAGKASVICSKLMQSLSCRTLSRCTVEFSGEQASIDSLLGRTAHLSFLRDSRIMKLIAEQLLQDKVE